MLAFALSLVTLVLILRYRARPRFDLYMCLTAWVVGAAAFAVAFDPLGESFVFGFTVGLVVVGYGLMAAALCNQTYENTEFVSLVTPLVCIFGVNILGCAIGPSGANDFPVVFQVVLALCGLFGVYVGSLAARAVNQAITSELPRLVVNLIAARSD